jgi:sigma-B regulation protein RsbU (phosphoserine phosphatase)
VLDHLGALAKGKLRLWREVGRGLEPSVGPDPGWRLPVPPAEGSLRTPEGEAWFVPLTGEDAAGFWLELAFVPIQDRQTIAGWVTPIVSAVVGRSREAVRLHEELAERSAQIELLYGISEVLGDTVRLEEAAKNILRELCDTLGARRGTLMVYEEGEDLLRIVAGRGINVEHFEPIRLSGAQRSVAADVFRSGRTLAWDPEGATGGNPGTPEGRTYIGKGFMSVPIVYGAPGANARTVGVINFTDRIGIDGFTPADRKLVEAVASQIGAAIANARLVQRDLKQQRVARELELAHDLQLRLLPSPSTLKGDAEIAARCQPVEQVGGDFYTFNRLGRGRVGVMLGDVSSHGFSAALIQTMVLSAAGIHAAAANSPDETLTLMYESIGPELMRADMYFSVFYGVIDPVRGRLDYASAGHPYAWRIQKDGTAERLEATAPPLGLGTAAIQLRSSEWKKGEDLLALWTDGLVEARSPAGEQFGEAHLLELVVECRDLSAKEIVAKVFAAHEEYSPKAGDDRTLLVMRV